ncbi:TetR/AcrR family transcriptional regulator C-terminal domain-containing protein [Streptomyces malaysiensis]|uniref:TetR/AcrR family transcriptional regulator C-terminal domain-containing protein n=1 Tax=Streptomyces malaysiensis TaxID=92644 RepID=UPI0011CE1E85|nr:TetR/AcrR family transcriptional regulator C-terminal domain-containing protein [Streptomyces malaysiensis]
MRSNRDRADQPTLEAIAEAALSVVDGEGPEALSFRRVAQLLGVSHATVFRRCGDFDGLVNACADRLAARMPLVGQDLDWATATEARFSAFYEVLIEHPGLVALRSGRAWWGPHLLSRLVEPQLAHSVAAGMTPDAAIRVYRRLYLLTLGAVAFVDHRDVKKVRSAARTALAALDPEDFPTLTGNLAVVLPALTDHEVYHGALRQLIDASASACLGGR